MNTNDLIERLAKDLEPATPLWRPGRRAALWCLGAVLYVAMLVIGMRLTERGADSDGWLTWVPQLIALVTGVLASAAAFVSTVPGLPRRVGVWAVGAVALWLASLFVASPGAIEWGGVLGVSHEWTCVALIVGGGAPLMFALTRMLRRGAPLSPAWTGGFAALAVATLANIGACLALPHANGAVTFVWHGGVVAALVLVGALSGRFLFHWRTDRARI